MAMIGVCVTIVGFVSVLGSGALRKWLQPYSYPMFIVLVVAAFYIALSTSYTYVLVKNSRKVYQATQWRAASSRRSPEANALLTLLAFLAPAGVDEELLLQAGNIPAPNDALRRILTQCHLP
jgi:hypothetical protein